MTGPIPPIALMLLAAVPQSAPSSPRAPEDMRVIAPALAGYTDNLLFGDVWKRPGLSPRDRSLVTVSALIASGKAPQLTSHLNLALDHGLTADELSALITNAAFYSGWPNAVSAVGVAKDVFARRGVAVTAKPGQSAAASMGPSGSPLARYSSVIDRLWAQHDLSPRDRALATVAALVASGDTAGLTEPLARGRAAGLTQAQVEEAVLHLSFYVGRPKAEAAEPFVQAAFQTSNGVVTGMTIIRRGSGERTAPPGNFIGQVRVGTAFRGTDGARVGGATVSFAPGARTAWHRHPLGQTLVVTEGCGWTQVEGGPVQRICAGDVVWVPPGAKHWHGATRSERMTHVALAEALDGKSVEWLEPVADAQYAAGEAVR